MTLVITGQKIRPCILGVAHMLMLPCLFTADARTVARMVWREKHRDIKLCLPYVSCNVPPFSLSAHPNARGGPSLCVAAESCQRLAVSKVHVSCACKLNGSNEDVSLLDLPLEKQEIAKNGKGIKNESKAVPVAPSASTKEEVAAEMRCQWKIQNRSQLSTLKVHVQCIVDSVELLHSNLRYW